MSGLRWYRTEAGEYVAVEPPLHRRWFATKFTVHMLAGPGDLDSAVTFLAKAPLVSDWEPVEESEVPLSVQLALCA